MPVTAACNCSWDDYPNVDAEGAWIDWVSSWCVQVVVWLNLLQTDFGCVILIVGSALHGLFILTRFEMCRFVGRNTTIAIWFPNEFELIILCIYSPAHALMWMATTSANWILMVVVMAVLSKQVCFVSLLKSINLRIMYGISCVYCVKPIIRSLVIDKSWPQRSEFSFLLFFTFWHIVVNPETIKCSSIISNCILCPALDNCTFSMMESFSQVNHAEIWELTYSGLYFRGKEPELSVS